MSSPEQAETDEQKRATGVGALLKASRLRIGDDLRQIANVLKIRYVFLEAIEDGRFEDLPGPTYSMGFVRAYAEHLGLDSDEVIRRFKNEVVGDHPEPSLDFPELIPEMGIPGGAIIFIGILVAAVAYGVWYVNTSQDGFMADLIAPLPDRLARQVAGGGEPKKAAPEVEMKTEPKPAMPVVTPTQTAAETATETAAETAALAPETAPAPEPSQAPETPAIAEPAAPPPEAAHEPASEAAHEPAPEAAPEPASEAAHEPASEAAPEPTPEAATAPEAAPAPAPTPASPPEPAAPVEAAAIPESAPTPESASVPESPPTPVIPVEALNAPSIVPVDMIPPAAPAPVSAPATPASQPAPAAQISALPAAAPNTETTPAPSSGQNRIVVRAKMNSWIQVRDDTVNELLVTRLLRAGDSYAVPDRSGLKLSTGNAGALEILVDGVVVPSIGGEGTVRRNVILDADRLKAGTAAGE